MPKLTLEVKPGSALAIGNGPVTFFSEHAPNVEAGDFFMIEATGQTPNLGEIGYLMPWEADGWPRYFGAVSPAGTLNIIGQASAAGNIGEGRGIVLASGVLPPGGPFPVNMFGYHASSFIPAGPASPPPARSIETLIAAVEQSWESHVPVADWIADADRNVTYMYLPPWANTPMLVTVQWSACLTDAAAAKVAALMGGTVKKEDAPDWACPFVAPNTPVPQVNYIYGTVAGVASRALGEFLVQAFNGRQAGLSITIPAAFQPVQ